MTATPTDMTSFTVAQFVVMGIFALLAVAGILFGMHLKRKRLGAHDDAEANREAAGIVEADVVPDTPPPAVEAAVPVSAAPLAPAPPPPGDAMPIDTSPAAAPAPLASDIRQLKGLGPKLAAALAELGITRVDQIAAMSQAELEELDTRLGTFRGRPARDRWAEQARLLTAGDKAAYEAEFGKLGGG